MRNQLRKGWFVNSGYYLLASVNRLFISILYGIVLSRYLGVEDYGTMSTIFSLSALFAGLAGFGIDKLLVRELASRNFDTDSLVVTSFLLKFINGIVLQAVYIFFMYFLYSTKLSLGLILVSSLVIVFQSQSIFSLILESQSCAKQITRIEFIAISLSAVTLVLLILTKSNLLLIVLCLTSEDFVRGILFLGASKATPLYPKRWFSFDLAKSQWLIREAWPLLVSSLAILIYMKIDQVMTFNLAGAVESGRYAAGVKVAEATLFFPVALSRALFPGFVRDENPRDYRVAKFVQISSFMIWLAILVSFSLTLFSDKIVTLLYGQQYSGSSMVLSIYCWSNIFVYYGISRSMFVLSQNLQIHMVVINISGAFSNVALNLLLIPRFQASGAAVATVISYFIACILIPLFVPPLRPTVRYFFKALAQPLYQLRAVLRS